MYILKMQQSSITWYHQQIEIILMVKLNRLTFGSASFDADQNRMSNLVMFLNSKIKVHMTIILRLLL